MACDDSNTISSEKIQGLDCNIGVIDDVVEKTDTTTQTCSGATIYTLRGQLSRLGWIPPIPYAASIPFTANDAAKTVYRSAAPEGWYAPRPEELPFTTSGTWAADDENKFYKLNANDLSQLSGNQNGNAITDMNAYIDAQTSLTYANLDAIPSALVEDGFETMVTADGISGPWVAVTGAHTANAGTIRTFGDDAGRYWKRSFTGRSSPDWYVTNRDGATNDAPAIAQAVYDNKATLLSRANYAVDGLAINDDNLILSGLGNRVSILTPTASSPTYSITQTSDYSYFSDMRIAAANSNMISVSGNSYYSTYNNVFFGPSDVAIDVADDFYWTNFIACHFRDNAVAIQCDTGQDFNAVTFLGGSFYHFNPTSAGPSVDIFGGDGVAFMGTHVQNQGMKFSSMDGIEIAGGYWECYDVPCIEAISSQLSISGGMYFPNATRFKFDPASIARLNGFGPNLSAKDSEGIDYPDNSCQLIAPVQKSVKNLFDDGDCSTQKAVDALAYSPTGAMASRVINGSSNVEISFSSTGARAAFRLPNLQGVSIFVKWRATAGTGRLALQDCTDNISLTHTSSTDSEWRYSHWHGKQSGANPALVFDPQSDLTTVIEVEKIIATDGYVFLQEGSGEYQLPSGKATLATGTATVSFPQPPTGDYRIFLQGNADENFWYTAKSLTGFTINSSNASSTAEVYWQVMLG